MWSSLGSNSLMYLRMTLSSCFYCFYVWTVGITARCCRLWLETGFSFLIFGYACHSLSLRGNMPSQNNYKGHSLWLTSAFLEREIPWLRSDSGDFSFCEVLPLVPLGQETNSGGKGLLPQGQTSNGGLTSRWDFPEEGRVRRAEI